MRGGVIAFTCALLFASAALGADSPVPAIADDEEYAVFAAVLFPQLPDVPDGGESRELFLARHRDRVRLDGFLAPAYTIAEGTDAGSPLTARNDPEGPDPALIADYNGKNRAPHRIDGEKLARMVPAGRVKLAPHSERARLFPGGRGAGLPDASLVWLSRVGFNADRTRAAVHVACRTGQEMGVAYLVLLHKSAKTGQWVLSSTTMTRVY
ncbi:MAG: hypothetical protein ACE147_17445 [Candidatus Methylomirabilales bacterium]